MNLNEYLDELLANDGTYKPELTPTRKAEGFKKTSQQFLKALKSAFEDAAYLQQVDAAFVAGIKDKVVELERRLAESGGN